VDIDYPRLYRFAADLAPLFADSLPFPHVVIDKLFPAETYAAISKAFPAPDSDIWKQPENAHTHNKRVTKRGPFDIKELLYDDQQRQIIREFNGAGFLHFLGLISGIHQLVPDPYLAEAGFHCSGNNGHLDIHADFSHHDRLDLERRINLIYFVNDEWQPGWGGELSLYDEALAPIATIHPAGNRAVVFQTGPTAYHGHPDPMRLPAGIWRRSIAMYYYTVPRPNRERSAVVFPADPGFKHKPTEI
jgi:Rps23 Pro-64 3,4-dihydroxylase Tpa1-like proline 4-hydroxylase